MKSKLFQWYPAISSWTFVLITLLIGYGRFIIPGHQPSLPGTYEAFAHIWVGILIATAIYKVDARLFSLTLLGIITTLETYKFFHQ